MVELILPDSRWATDAGSEPIDVCGRRLEDVRDPSGSVFKRCGRRRGYTAHVRLHLVPHLGQVLAELDVGHLDRTFTALRGLRRGEAAGLR